MAIYPTPQYAYAYMLVCVRFSVTPAVSCGDDKRKLQGRKEGREKSEGGLRWREGFVVVLHLKAIVGYCYSLHCHSGCMTLFSIYLTVFSAGTLPTYMYTYYFLYGTLLFLAKALSPIITKASVLKMLPRHCY